MYENFMRTKGRGGGGGSGVPRIRKFSAYEIFWIYSITKTAINTPIGQFDFSVLGFYLTNSPATISMMMNNKLRPFLRKSGVVFLEDILIYSRTWEEHVRHVREVLQTLRTNKLFCKPAKCVFGAESVKFLGYVVPGFSLAPDKERLPQ